MTRPLVSVCVVTYNQENFIKKCIDGIISQEGKFDLEIIVGDDCSTDKTRNIISDYAEKYPDIIKVLKYEHNIGAVENFLNVHSRAQGDYVCHCDGDDFWLPGKIAYQLELFKKYPDLVQTWHCAHRIDDNNNKIGIFPSTLARFFYPKWIKPSDIALSYALVGHHSTQMYRRSARVFERKTEVVLDYWVAFNIALQGKSYYSKKIFSTYRVGNSESLTKTSGTKRLTVDALVEHVSSIYDNHPCLRKNATSNILVRKLFSKLKDHDLSKVDGFFKERKIHISFLCIIKSLFFFALQKVGF